MCHYVVSSINHKYMVFTYRSRILFTWNHSPANVHTSNKSFDGLRNGSGFSQNAYKEDPLPPFSSSNPSLPSISSTFTHTFQSSLYQNPRSHPSCVVRSLLSKATSLNVHFTPIFLLAAGALAFSVPKGQPDGVYQVYTAPDGTETHTSLRGLNDDSIEARSAIPGKFSLASKRQVPGIDNNISCGGYNLPRGDTDAANGALDAQCGGGANVGQGYDFYSISGCVVAYFCNESGGPQFCFAGERQQASAAITNVCGSYYAGWDHIHSSARNDVYGYEDNCGAGKNFCGRGVNGKKL